MKSIIAISLLLLPFSASAFSSLAEQARYFQDVYGNPSSPTQVTKTEMNRGETRPKAVLKGVFYFGGSDQGRKLLSSSYQNLMCEHGFSQAYSVYDKPSKGTSCSGNSMEYSHIGQASVDSDGGSRVASLMRKLYRIIKANGSEGPVYVHCYYGVHASNTIAQMVLKQFCGISDATAVANWNKVDLYDSLGEPNLSRELEKVQNYSPDPSLQLSASEKATVCY